MDLTVAVWTGFVLNFIDVQISDPVGQREGTPEYYIDRTVRWKVAYIALSIIKKMIESFGGNKASCWTAVLMFKVVTMSAVRILAQLK